MIDSLISIDTEAFLWLNSQHSPYWDIVMKMASGKLIWIPMYAALLFAYCRAFNWKKAIVAVILTVLAVTAADQVTATVIRPFCERLRPSNPNNTISEFVHIVNGYRGGKYGFPSCHAANTFAVVLFTSFVFNRWKYTVFITFWALLNCYSRIYLGVHYPGDLLVGMLIGSLCGTVCFLIGSMISKWLYLGSFNAKEKIRSFLLGRNIICYLPSDAVIIVGILTMGGILIYGALL